MSPEEESSGRQVIQTPVAPQEVGLPMGPLSVCLCLSICLSLSLPLPRHRKPLHISTGVHVCGRTHSHTHAYTPKALMSVVPNTAMGAGRTSKGMCVTARPPSLC